MLSNSFTSFSYSHLLSTCPTISHTLTYNEPATKVICTHNWKWLQNEYVHMNRWKTMNKISTRTNPFLCLTFFIYFYVCFHLFNYILIVLTTMNSTEELTPRIYIDTIRIIGFLTGILNVFVAYVIINHSPSAMKVYKWYLLYYHTSNIICDVLLSEGVVSDLMW